MKKLLLASLATLIRRGLFPAQLLSYGPAGKRCAVLIFHRVLQKSDPFAMAPVLAPDFDALLYALQTVFEIVPLQTLSDEAAQGLVKPRRLAITFDDGYLDNYTTALPILKQRNAHATVFLATHLIGTGQIAWYDRVLEAARVSNMQTFSAPDLGLQGEGLENPDRRAAFAFQVLEGLKRLPPEARNQRIALLEREWGGAGETPRLMLNWDEARQMQQSGHITLGAHTQSHPILSRIVDAAIHQEIQGSRDDIAQQLGVMPKLFAYPNGRKADFDERSKRSLTQLGFTCAVTTEAGVNNAQTDPLEWHRLQAWDGDAFAMTARIALELLRG